MNPYGGRRGIYQFICRSHRAAYQFSLAVGAAMVEVSFSAGGAEGTFKGANSGVQGIRRQVAITPFTVRAKFEHRFLPFSGLRLPHYAREAATPRQRYRRVESVVHSVGTAFASISS